MVVYSLGCGVRSMNGESYETSAESINDVVDCHHEDVVPHPRAGRSPRFTRAYAEVVRDLLDGRYVVGETIEWEPSSRRMSDDSAVVGAGGPGLLLEGAEAHSGDPVSILILDPLLWPDDESFHTARLAANRMSTLKDSTLILPRRVLWDVSARCIVLVLDPVPPPPHRGPGEAHLDERGLRRAGVALCRAARTLTKLGQGGITCDEVWFTPDGDVRVLRVPGIRRDPAHGAAQGVASVVQRMLEGAGVTPDMRLARALRRARATPRYEDAEALEVLQRSLSSRGPVRVGATAAMLVGAAGLVWLATGLTWVDEGERVAVVNAWGRQRHLTHGLHLKWPTPIESVRSAAPVAAADLERNGGLAGAEPLDALLDDVAAEVSLDDEANSPIAQSEAPFASGGEAPAIDPSGGTEAPALDLAAQAGDAEPESNATEIQPSLAAATGLADSDHPPQVDAAEAAPSLAVVDAEPAREPAAAQGGAGNPAPEPYPAAELARYYAHGAVQQTRAAVDEVARRIDQLADRRIAAAQRGDDHDRLIAAEAMRIFGLRGVDALWLGRARIRIQAAEAAIADGNGPVALQSLSGVLDEAIGSLARVEGAEAAAEALLHAQAAERTWLTTPEAEQSIRRGRAEQALAEIASGREALASGDLVDAARRLTSGARALDGLATEMTLAAVQEHEDRVLALFEEWQAAWADLDGAGFPAPEDIATARRRHARGLEHLAEENATDAVREFDTAADLLRGRLERLADERSRAGQIDHRGRTPLHHAASDGDAQRARYALALGSPVHARDIEGDCALRLAILKNHLAVARVLLEHGADANDRAGSGRPLIFDAVGSPAAFVLLLNHGARAGWTVRGSTLLHEVAWARARHGVGDADQVKMAIALLDRGVDPLMADASGETPLQIAERTRATALAEFLRERTGIGRELEQAGSGGAPAQAD